MIGIQSAAGFGIPLNSAEFLELHGLKDQVLVPLVADASSRRYYRLPNRHLLLMEDRLDPVGFDSFIRLSKHLRELGLSAPQVFASDALNGLALIEDFGVGTYSACLQEGQDEKTLYTLAVDALLQIHNNPDGANIAQDHYDIETLLSEIDVFSEWYAPEIAPNLDRDQFTKKFRALWTDALQPVAKRFDTLVLRDFHVDNLMLLPHREGAARCGLLDFQDGVIGPREYDLVSLLQDARRDLSPGLESQLIAHYIANASSRLGTEKEIVHRYYVLAAQRHTRIAGVFIRLNKRDNKPRYLRFLPRVIRQMEAAIANAGLTEVQAFLGHELTDWQEKGLALHTS